jgi:hypothetical protein
LTLDTSGNRFGVLRAFQDRFAEKLWQAAAIARPNSKYFHLWARRNTANA